MSLHPQTRVTPEEDPAQERQALYKSEYVNGENFAIAGDMRVKVIPTGLCIYPDVVVVCDDPQDIPA